MKKTGVLLLVLMTALAGCRGVKGDPARITTGHPLVRAVNGFAFSVFGQVLSGEKGNVFLSPVSLHLALGMAYNGASARTAGEMAQALRVAGLTREDYLRGTGDLIRYLERASGAARLYIANSLWKQKGYPFNPAYLGEGRDFFGAPVRSVTFGTGEGQRRVNAWIKEKTSGMIPRMLAKPLDPVTRLLIVNSIYFKGKWKNSFPKRATSRRGFSTPSGMVAVPMMSVRARFRYTETADYQAVLLPYKRSGLAMAIVLPRRKAGLRTVLSNFGSAEYGRMLAGMGMRRGLVSIPRFNIDFGVKRLNEPLMRLGIRDAFSDSRADFSRMSGNRELFVKAVLHKARLEVDEEGSTAAAATVVRMDIKSIRPVSMFRFIADHPFLLFILDEKRGVILFTGVLRDPSKRG